MVIKSRFLVTALLWSTTLSLFACSPSPLEKGGFGVKAVAGLSNAGPISQSMKQRLKVLHHQIRRPENKKDYQQTFLKDVLPKQGRRNKKGGFGIKSLNAPFIEDFSTATASFGDGTNGWFEWGGDYSRDPNSEAVKLNNPGTTSNVVESGLTKTIPLSGVEGDTLIAKMKVKSTFTADSDTTLVLYFNDSAQTVAVSDTSRGSMAGEQTLYIETTIPAGATNVTIAPLVYLAAGEQSTALIDEISVEEIPSDHYSKINLLDEPFDEKGTNDYGPNSPLNVDSEFGHDFYVVDNWPQKYSGDGAVTLWNGGPSNHSTDEGGLVKRVDFTNVQQGDKLSAYLYTAPTFNNSESMAEFKLEFYNESNSLLSTTKSTAVRGSNYKWLFIDRQPIPTGASYVKLVPTVKLGNTESSSLLWDDLRLYQYHQGEESTSPSQEQIGASIQAEIGPDGGTIEIPGVAKLEIPAGAVSTPTIIKMNQILNVQPDQGIDDDQEFYINRDFVSSVIQIEPSELQLNKPAILHAETDIQRLGENHPVVMQWACKEKLDGKDFWKTYVAKGYDSLPFDQWSSDMLLEVEKLGRCAKMIPAYMQPNDNFNALESKKPVSSSGNSGFQTQSHITPSHRGTFLITYDENTFTNRQDVLDWSALLEEAYAFYATFTNTTPKGSIHSQGYIPVTLSPTIPVFIQDPNLNAFVGPADEIEPGPRMFFQGTNRSVEGHEMWHVFQLSPFSRSVLREKDPKGWRKWMIEGSAVHMAAYLGRLNPHFKNELYPHHYNNHLFVSQQSIDKPLRRPQVSSDPFSTYDTVGFFSFLASPNADYNREKVLWEIAKNYQDSTNDNSDIASERALNKALGYQLSEVFRIYADYALAAAHHSTETYPLLNFLNMEDRNLPVKISYHSLNSGPFLKNYNNQVFPCLSAKYIPIFDTQGKKNIKISFNSSTPEFQVSAVYQQGQNTFYDKNIQNKTLPDGIENLTLVVSNAQWGCSNPEQQTVNGILKVDFTAPKITSAQPRQKLDNEGTPTVTVIGSDLTEIKKIVVSGNGQTMTVTPTVNSDGTSMTFTPPVSGIGTYGMTGLGDGCSSPENCSTVIGIGSFQVINHCNVKPELIGASKFAGSSWDNSHQWLRVYFCGQMTSLRLSYSYYGNKMTTTYQTGGSGGIPNSFELSFYLAGFIQAETGKEYTVTAEIVIGTPTGELTTYAPITVKRN